MSAEVMFQLRFAAICLGALFILYALLSIAVSISWRFLRNKGFTSTTLLTLRLSPLVLSLFSVAFFVAPSFLYFEPRALEEEIGAAAIIAALAGMIVLLAGAWRAGSAWWKVAAFLKRAIARARRVKSVSAAPVYSLPEMPSAMMVVGVTRPALLISEKAVALLDERELRAAMRHELAHLRRRDNLKRLLFNFCAWPTMTGSAMADLERSWLHAAELEADADAVCDVDSAADLASALLKIARHTTSAAVPAIAMALVPDRGAPLASRVDRLLHWEPVQTGRKRIPATILTAVPLLTLAILTYSHVLSGVHEMTELFLR